MKFYGLIACFVFVISLGDFTVTYTEASPFSPCSTVTVPSAQIEVHKINVKSNQMSDIISIFATTQKAIDITGDVPSWQVITRLLDVQGNSLFEDLQPLCSLMSTETPCPRLANSVFQLDKNVAMSNFTATAVFVFQQQQLTTVPTVVGCAQLDVKKAKQEISSSSSMDQASDAELLASRVLAYVFNCIIAVILTLSIFTVLFRWSPILYAKPWYLKTIVPEHLEKLLTQIQTSMYVWWTQCRPSVQSFLTGVGSTAEMAISQVTSTITGSSNVPKPPSVPVMIFPTWFDLILWLQLVNQLAMMAIPDLPSSFTNIIASLNWVNLVPFKSFLYLPVDGTAVHGSSSIMLASWTKSSDIGNESAFVYAFWILMFVVMVFTFFFLVVICFYEYNQYVGTEENPSFWKWLKQFILVDKKWYPAFYSGSIVRFLQIGFFPLFGLALYQLAYQWNSGGWFILALAIFTIILYVCLGIYLCMHLITFKRDPDLLYTVRSRYMKLSSFYSHYMPLQFDFFIVTWGYRALNALFIGLIPLGIVQLILIFVLEIILLILQQSAKPYTRADIARKNTVLTVTRIVSLLLMLMFLPEFSIPYMGRDIVGWIIIAINAGIMLWFAYEIFVQFLYDFSMWRSVRRQRALEKQLFSKEERMKLTRFSGDHSSLLMDSTRSVSSDIVGVQIPLDDASETSWTNSHDTL